MSSEERPEAHRARFRRRESVQHPIGVESLADEIAIQPLEFAVVGDRLPSAEPLRQRRVEQGVVVDAVEHLIGGALRGRFRDAGALDLHPHAHLAALAHGGLGARDRFGDARVVDGAFLEQAGHGVVDGVGFVALAGEPLTDLQFRELAAGEHFHAVDVGGSSCQIW